MAGPRAPRPKGPQLDGAGTSRPKMPKVSSPLGSRVSTDPLAVFLAEAVNSKKPLVVEEGLGNRWAGLLDKVLSGRLAWDEIAEDPLDGRGVRAMARAYYGGNVPTKLGKDPDYIEGTFQKADDLRNFYEKVKSGVSREEAASLVKQKPAPPDKGKSLGKLADEANETQRKYDQQMEVDDEFVASEKARLNEPVEDLKYGEANKWEPWSPREPPKRELGPRIGRGSDLRELKKAAEEHKTEVSGRQYEQQRIAEDAEDVHDPEDPLAARQAGNRKKPSFFPEEPDTEGLGVVTPEGTPITTSTPFKTTVNTDLEAGGPKSIKEDAPTTRENASSSRLNDSIIDGDELSVVSLPIRPDGKGPTASQQKTFVTRRVAKPNGTFDYVPVRGHVFTVGDDVILVTGDGSGYRLPSSQSDPAPVARMEEVELRNSLDEARAALGSRGSFDRVTFPEDVDRQRELQKNIEAQQEGRVEDLFESRDYEGILDRVRGLPYEAAKTASRIPFLREAVKGPLEKAALNPPGKGKSTTNSALSNEVRATLGRATGRDAAEAAAVNQSKFLQDGKTDPYSTAILLDLRQTDPDLFEEIVSADPEVSRLMSSDAKIASSLAQLLEPDAMAGLGGLPEGVSGRVVSRAMDFLEKDQAGAVANSTQMNRLNELRSQGFESAGFEPPDQRVKQSPPVSEGLSNFIKKLRSQGGIKGSLFLGGLESRGGATRNITRPEMQRLKDLGEELEAARAQGNREEVVRLKGLVNKYTNRLLGSDGVDMSAGEAAALSGVREQALPDRHSKSSSSSIPDADAGDFVTGDFDLGVLTGERQQSDFSSPTEVPRGSGRTPDAAGFNDGFRSAIGSTKTADYIKSALTDPAVAEELGMSPSEVRENLYLAYVRSGLGENGDYLSLDMGSTDVGRLEYLLKRKKELAEERKLGAIQGKTGGLTRTEAIARELAEIDAELQATPGYAQGYDQFQAMLDESLGVEPAEKAPTINGPNISDRIRSAVGNVRSGVGEIFDQPSAAAAIKTPSGTSSSSDYLSSFLENVGTDIGKPLPENMAFDRRVIDSFKNPGRLLTGLREKVFTKPDQRTTPVQQNIQGFRRGLFTPDQLEALRQIKETPGFRFGSSEEQAAMLGRIQSGKDWAQQMLERGEGAEEFGDLIRELSLIGKSIEKTPTVPASEFGPLSTSMTMEEAGYGAQEAVPARARYTGSLASLSQNPAAMDAGWSNSSFVQGGKPMDFYVSPDNEAAISVMEALQGKRIVRPQDILGDSASTMTPGERLDARRAVLGDLNSRGLGQSLGFDDDNLAPSLDEMARNAAAEDAALLTEASNKITAIDRSYAGDMPGGTTDGMQIGTPLEKGGQVVLPVTTKVQVPKVGSDGSQFIEKTFYVPGGYEPISSAGGTKAAAGFRYNPETNDFSAPPEPTVSASQAAARVMKSERTLSDSEVPIIKKGQPTEMPEGPAAQRNAEVPGDVGQPSPKPEAPRSRIGALAKKAALYGGGAAAIGGGGLGLISAIQAKQQGVHDPAQSERVRELIMENERPRRTAPNGSTKDYMNVMTYQVPFAGNPAF